VAFPTKLLQPHEELVLDLRPHWWYLAPVGAALAGAAVLGMVTLGAGAPSPIKVLAGLLIVAALIVFAVRYVRWATTSFAVTSERIIFRQGLVARRGVQMPLEKVNTVDFHQNIWERLIGAGDLVIESGNEHGLETFTDIRKPLAVQQEINRQMDLHDRNRWAPPPAPVDPPAALGLTVPEQLEKLAELRDRGVLTPAEFEATKAQLLDRL
jgi:membrane protein YdbS with pleckstrin-like domain